MKFRNELKTFNLSIKSDCRISSNYWLLLSFLKWFGNQESYLLRLLVIVDLKRVSGSISSRHSCYSYELLELLYSKPISLIPEIQLVSGFEV